MLRFPIASRDAVPQDQVDAFDALVSSRGGVVPEFGPSRRTTTATDTPFKRYSRGESAAPRDGKWEVVLGKVAPNNRLGAEGPLARPVGLRFASQV